MVGETASKPLDQARGSTFACSNQGYTIADAILERTGGKAGRNWSKSESLDRWACKVPASDRRLSLRPVHRIPDSLQAFLFSSY